MTIAGLAAGLVRGLRSVAPGDRAPFLRAWGQLLLIRVGLRVPVLRYRLLSGTPVGPSGVAAPDTRLLALFSEAVAAQGTAPPCLPRAVALARFLRTMGVTASLRLGVRRDEAGRPEGHAWVEHDGRPLADPPAFVDSFVPMDWPAPHR